MPYQLIQESRLNAPPEAVWELVRRMSTVNVELSPFAGMTFPGDDYAFSEKDTELGAFLFKSCILLFGVLPMDWHYVRMNKVVDGQGFSEDSVSLMHKYWRHDRWIEPAEKGCILHDKVVFLPRLPLVGNLALLIYRVVFRNRHRKLSRLIGTDHSGQTRGRK